VHPIGIWLGVNGPRALRLAGRAADGWVVSFRGDLDQIADMAARLNDAAAEASRDPGDIRRILNVSGEITDGASNGILRGPVDQWVDELTGLAVAHGFDTFILWAEGEDQLPRFAEEVAPAVRAQVAAERG
jgi:alkanesulfonate monooxygenase SsuD/methylene tetrahydromethanopterin reductase-like flavin-dependent oxidoreductase (luciferase family)